MQPAKCHPIIAAATPPASPDAALKRDVACRPQTPVDQVARTLLPSLLSPVSLSPPAARTSRAAIRCLQADAPTQIRPHLWVGGIDQARDRMFLITMGITHILSAAAEYPPAALPGMQSLHIALYDRTNERTASHVPEAIAFIEAARREGGRVFVHCQHGISRSITLVLAYLMQTERMTLGAAMTAVRALRAQSEPNPSFLAELREMECGLFGELKTTQQLTVLDPGPLDLASSDAQSQHILQNCLAAASKVDDQDSQDRYEQHAASLLERDELSAGQALLIASIMQSYESFAGTSARNQKARQSLHRIVGHLHGSSAQGRRVVMHALTGLMQTPQWQDLTLDVPLANAYLADLQALIGLNILGD